MKLLYNFFCGQNIFTIFSNFHHSVHKCIKEYPIIIENSIFGETSDIFMHISTISQVTIDSDSYSFTVPVCCDLVSST